MLTGERHKIKLMRDLTGKIPRINRSVGEPTKKGKKYKTFPSPNTIVRQPAVYSNESPDERVSKILEA